MTAWLLSIVGITVVGVLVELLLTDSPMSKFVRSIYTFFILFIIVSPIPGMFKNFEANIENPNIQINTDFVQTQTLRRVEAALSSTGFPNASAKYANDKIVIKFQNPTNIDRAKVISIVVAVANIPAEKVEVQ